MPLVKIGDLALDTAALDPTDIVPFFQVSTGLTKGTPVSNLPGGSGGGTGTALGSPFKVKNGDASYVINGDNSVITDVRLIGKSGYVVSSTQISTEFRDAELTYDDVHGKLTILNFILDAGEHVTIYADGVVTATTGYNSILTDLTTLKLIAAPFYLTVTGANGGMLLWKRPVSDIPPGWQEVVNWRGRLPMGYDPGDADFNTIGATGGIKQQVIVEANIQEITVSLPTADGAIPGGYSSSFVGLSQSSSTHSTVKVGVTTPTPLELNPYRIAMFIEFVGL
jgi:hypothetical protein